MQLQKLSKTEIDQNSRLMKNIIDTKNDITTDSSYVDSLVDDPKKNEEKNEILSVYESMLKGYLVNPDSIITKVKIFGQSVFKKAKFPNFQTNPLFSIPSDYPISSGDEINILMWGRINEEHKLIVDRTGHINIPRIGPVIVGGLSYKTMQERLKSQIQNIEGVKTFITMGSLNDIQIFIVGGVSIPGQYTVNALTSVTNALFYADGFSKQGSMRNVHLKRNGKTIHTFDFYNFLLSGNSYNNIHLKSGDVIFVPTVKKMATIAGNVRQSAIFELKGKTTLKDMIKLAGGLTPTAWINRIQVDRFSKHDQQIVFDLKTKNIFDLPDFLIKDGDVIKIFPIVTYDKNTIFLSGNIKRPGKYEYTENMKISDLLYNYEQLLPETYLNYAVIRRQEPPSYSERILSFNLQDIFDKKDPLADIALLPRDNIIIYNKDFFEPDRKVIVSGAVTIPGSYKILMNMQIKDLILEAGGLNEEASTDRGELYKRIFEQDSVRTIKIDFNVTEAMKGNPKHNHTLSKSDNVFVRKKRGWENQKTIKLVGEFIYPGKYVLLDGETLDLVIKRAGGFKPNAYLSAAIFTRESVKDMEKQRTDEYINRLEQDIMTLSAEMASKGSDSQEIQAVLNQQTQLLEKLKNSKTIGRIVIDFQNSDNYKDLELEDGDVLYIPKNHNTVSVIGEIFNPATFVLEKRMGSVNHYIQLAGGYKENANKGDMYVIKANGSVRTKKMVRFSRYHLDAGDAVVIPPKLPTSNQRFRLFLQSTSQIIAITSNSLLIAGTINSLMGKNTTKE